MQKHFETLAQMNLEYFYGLRDDYRETAFQMVHELIQCDATFKTQVIVACLWILVLSPLDLVEATTLTEDIVDMYLLDNIARPVSSAYIMELYDSVSQMVRMRYKRKRE